MKKILLTFSAIILFLGSAYAQGNPAVSSVGFGASPIIRNTTTTLTVVVSNATFSSGAIPAGQFRVTISLPSNLVYTLSNLQTPPGNGNTTTPTTAQISDNAGNAFNWVGDGSGVYQGTSNTAIAQGGQVTIVLQIYGNITSASTTTTVNVQGLAGTSTTNASGDDNGSASLAIDAPLPVTLSKFGVVKEEAVSQLSWTTTEETNSNFFEVQHSADAKLWKVLGKVKSSDKGKAVNNYAFTHNAPINGVNYYRLKMVDHDDTFSYSGMKSVTFDNLFKARLFPNPVSNTLTIEARSWADVSSVELINASGVSVYRSGTNPVNSIDVKHLNNGVYLVKLVNKDGTIEKLKAIVAR